MKDVVGNAAGTAAGMAIAGGFDATPEAAKLASETPSDVAAAINQTFDDAMRSLECSTSGPEGC